MRELDASEIKSVSGGNMFFAGVFAIASSYYGGRSIGESIYGSITDSFSMSPGEAAYRTFND